MEENLDQMILDYKKEKDIDKKFEKLNSIVVILIRKGKFQEIIGLNEKFYKLAEKNNHELAKAKSLSFIATAYFYSNQDKKSLEYDMKAVDLFYKLKDYEMIVISCNRIAGIHARNGRNSKAIECLMKGLDVTKDLDIHIKSVVYANLANVYISQNDHDKAIECLEESQKIDDKFGRKNFFTVFNLTSLHYKQGEYNKALSIIDPIVKKTKERKDFYNYVLACRVKIGCLIDLKRINEAMKLSKETEEICERENFEDLALESYNDLAFLYNSKKFYKKAFYYMKKYSDLQYTINKRNMEEKTLKLEAEYELKVKEKDKEIYQLKNKELQSALDELKKAYDELEKVQKEVIKAEKLSAALATVVTANHKINQPLMVIQGNCDLIYETSKNKEVQKKYYNRIKENIERINKTLKTFDKIKEYKIKEYASGVKMLDIDDIEKEVDE